MRPLRHPGLWFAAFALWFAVLWWFSSDVRELPETGLDFTDKILHFGWFFGGAGLLSAALHARDPLGPTLRRILLATVVTTLCGVLDELHQSFIEGRQGNDPFDLIADFLGAAAGACVFQPLRRVVA